MSVDLSKAALTLGLEERLKLVPTSAKVRGVFFHLIEAQLRRRGLAGHPEWRKASAVPRQLNALYPAADLLRSLTVGGALLNPDAKQGVRDIFSDGTRFVAHTWIGEALRTALTPDPRTALRWLVRAHPLLANYVSWRLEEHGPGRATLHMVDEYCWIDSLHLGGCEGLLRTCGVSGSVQASMDDLFNGRLEIVWEPRD